MMQLATVMELARMVVGDRCGRRERVLVKWHLKGALIYIYTYFARA